MCLRYTFLHTCGHVGFGPVLHTEAPQADIYGLTIRQEPVLDAIQLPLFFACPFCSDARVYHRVEPGSGVLVILTSSHDSPFAMEWEILRVCDADEITSQDWDMSHTQGAIFRQMAWIPKPCGRVFVSRGRRSEPVVEVESAWTQSLREPVRSRLPGMLSELGAVLRSGEGSESDIPRILI